jgi:hypothetical protein
MRGQRVVNVGILGLAALASTLLVVDTAAPAAGRPRDVDQSPRPIPGSSWTTGTVGASAAVQELVRTHVDGTTAVLYRVRVAGFGMGQRVHVWMRRQTGVVQFLADDVTANTNGVLVSGDDPTEAFLVLAVAYAAGEPFDLAILSADQRVCAFARAVPFLSLEESESR